jgi:hypothetical protein
LSLTSAEEAEERATNWLRTKHRNRIKKLRFTNITLENGVWRIRGELHLKAGIFAHSKHVLVISIEAATGKIVGYTEGSPGS